jgi:hypothetical protein
MIKEKKIVIPFLVCLFLCVTTCTKDIYAPSACFSENILPIFISNCTMSGCHNSYDREGGYDLSNYEGIRQGVNPKHPLLSEIYKTIKGKNPSMPQKPYPNLSRKDVSLIKLWINAGARNTTNCTSCDSNDYSYGARVASILNNWCVGCHNPNSKGGNIDLSNYQGVLSVISDERLLASIKHLPGYSAMPKNGGAMSACEIRIIEKWINAGYPDN